MKDNSFMRGAPKVSPRRGFTLIELLVVIAIIALLLGILMPALKKIKDIAAMKICQNNARQIALAAQSYAMDHDEILPFSGTSTRENGAWVCWPMDINGNYNPDPMGTPPTLDERLRGIRHGVLYDYVGSTDVYHCPSDKRMKTLQGGYRTYSFSQTINAGQNSNTDWYGPTVEKLSDIRNPALRLMIIEEGDPRGYNYGSWVLLGTGQSGQPGGATTPNFSDPIAYWHNNGCIIAYADSHAEYYIFKERDTVRWLMYVEQEARAGGQTIIWYSQTPGITVDPAVNEDWLFFNRIYSF